MPFREAFFLAITAIRTAKLRSFFTLLGIIVSVGFLVAVVAIIQGMNSYVRDNLRSAMIGTKAELGPYLSKSILDGITGSFLGVYALDADPRRFVLVVSGNTAAEVAQAARTFAFLNFPYPDTPSVLVSAIEYAALTDYSGRNTLTHQEHVPILAV